ncbi:MAG TPA: glycosyltransferase family 2 protein [Acidimicrobiales bacterium]|nr:glycosyltransferase family 2 protein [Acidimicrobiales bacterium]
MPEADQLQISAAEAAFAAEHGTGPGHPLCVVMAALNEAEVIGDVVRSIPPEVCGLQTECLVVDDGSTDGTAEAARQAGALVCRLGVNLGQGLALRAGYGLASSRRALYIATMDADGQFDAGELERLIAPLVAGRADMVNGSRRLGRSETTDRVRAAGVVAFGALVSVLSGTRITDPANGFRAFIPEVPQRVPLRQPQYQTSELLMGALGLGYRVVEVPVTVRPRVAGHSKKGTNLLYGYRFGRVILTTWWSQRRRRAGRPARPHS